MSGGLAAGTDLRPTPALPGIWIRCTGWDSVATAYALCRCGWKHTGMGRGASEAVTAAYDEHRQQCSGTTRKEDADGHHEQSADRGRRAVA